MVPHVLPHLLPPAQVDARQTLKPAPLPLATLALQKEAITHLRMPGEHMMKLAEELYQEGAISYPRTETDCFDPAYDLRVRSPARLPSPECPAQCCGLCRLLRVCGTLFMSRGCHIKLDPKAACYQFSSAHPGDCMQSEGVIARTPCALERMSKAQHNCQGGC